MNRRPGEIPTHETRHEANKKVNRKKRYSQIIEILTEVDKPLTAKQIAVIMKSKGYAPVSERNISQPRLHELSVNGIVEPCGKTKCEYTGAMVTVYKLRKEEKNV